MVSPRGKNEVELPQFSSSLRVVRINGKRARRVVVSKDQMVGAFVNKLVKVLGKPGVDKATLFSSEKTPVFRAHPSRPGLLIRSFRSGKQQTGRITADGAFKVVPENSVE